MGSSPDERVAPDLPPGAAAPLGLCLGHRSACTLLPRSSHGPCPQGRPESHVGPGTPSFPLSGWVGGESRKMGPECPGDGKAPRSREPRGAPCPAGAAHREGSTRRPAGDACVRPRAESGLRGLPAPGPRDGLTVSTHSPIRCLLVEPGAVLGAEGTARKKTVSCPRGLDGDRGDPPRAAASHWVTLQSPRTRTAASLWHEVLAVGSRCPGGFTGLGLKPGVGADPSAVGLAVPRTGESGPEADPFCRDGRQVRVDLPVTRHQTGAIPFSALPGETEMGREAGGLHPDRGGPGGTLHTCLHPCEPEPRP